MTVERTIAIGDIRVVRLGFGTMSLTGRGTWGPPADRTGAVAVLRHARGLGVQLFDTADSYGPDVAEELLAEAFGPRYEDVTVATKAGLTRQGPGRWGRDCRPEHLRTACEGSLRRLGVERIDLFQLHTVDPAVPLEESLGTLVDLQTEGKIREIGVCNVDVAELGRALTCAPVASVQNRYSLVERSSDDVVALCEAHGLAFLAWAPLAKGALAGARGGIEQVAQAKGATPGQIALAWLLHRSPCTVPIPGTSSVAHLSENTAAAGIDLSPDDVARLEGQRHFGYAARRIRRRARMRVDSLGRGKSAGRSMRTGLKVVAALVVAAVIAVGTSAVFDAPSRSMTTTTLVQAPREEVWRLLLDFEGYSDWNPSMRIDGMPVLGGSIEVRLGIEGDTRELDATIYVLNPPRKLRWQSRLLLPGVRDVEYEIIVSPVSPRVTEVIQHVRDEGLLVPMTEQVPTREDMAIMAAALARTAEARA